MSDRAPIAQLGRLPLVRTTRRRVFVTLAQPFILQPPSSFAAASSSCSLKSLGDSCIPLAIFTAESADVCRSVSLCSAATDGGDDTPRQSVASAPLGRGFDTFRSACFAFCCFATRRCKLLRLNSRLNRLDVPKRWHQLCTRSSSPAELLQAI